MANYRFVKIKPPFNIETCFWHQNNQLKYIEPYKTLYDNDPKADEEDSPSSKTMWCVWLYLDPNYENKIGKIRDEKEKRSAILAYYSEFDFNDPLVSAVLTAYPNDCLSDAAKSFKKEEEGLRKFADVLEDYLEKNDLTFDHTVQVTPHKTQIVKGTATQYADLKMKNSKLYTIYDKVRRMFEEEQSSIRIHGGGKETLIDRGGLIMIKD